MPLDALPPHLQANPLPAGDGTDGDNAAQRNHNRGWTAFGPRVERQRWTWARVGIPWTRASVPVLPVLARWRLFPRLWLGFNVARWMTVEDKSVLFVGRFARAFFWPWTKLYQVPAIEMQNGNPQKGESFTAMIRGRAWDTDAERWGLIDVYGPSPIQSFSFGWSWALTWPLHFVVSYRRRVTPEEHVWNWLRTVTRQKKPGEFIFMFRVGARWDSGDMYFVFPATALGFDWN